MWLILVVPALFCSFVPAHSQCTEGYYEQLDGTCAVCPAGKYADVAGATECSDCPSGRYLDDDGVNWKLHAHPLYCARCPMGRASNMLGATECTNCSAGRFADSLGATQCDACQYGIAPSSGTSTCEACELGSVPDSLFVTCDPCPAGKFNDYGVSCEDCFSGYVSSAGSSACEECAAGKYFDSGNGTCIDCAAGKFSFAGSTVCYGCWAGTAAAAGSGDCSPCPVGRFAEQEASECSPCENGTYAPSEEQQFCDWCPWNSISGPAASVCDQCEAGKEANSEQTECVPCAAGKYLGQGSFYCADCFWGYASSAGSSACSECEPGRYMSSDQSECTQCELGKYQDYAGYDSCWDCWAVVNTNRTDCTPCGDGTIVVGTTVRACVACEAGKHSNYDVCEPCQKGYYSSQAGAAFCEPCDGLTTLETGSASIQDCKIPPQNQAFECVQAKQCQITGFQNVETLNASRLMVLAQPCNSSQDDLINALYGSGNFPGWETTESMNTDGGGRSSSGSTDFQWTGTVELQVGQYSLCWCGGADSSHYCDLSHDFDISVGSMTVLGPYADQEITCVQGRLCLNQGPIRGLGLGASDEIHIRSGCDSVSATSPFGEYKLSVTAQTSGQEVELLLSLPEVAWIATGTYSLCWCSALGTSCSEMNATSFATYLEAGFGTVLISGPKGGEFSSCYAGQLCLVYLQNGGTLEANDRISFTSKCGVADFIPGLPGLYMSTITSDNLAFGFVDNVSQNEDAFLRAEPGMYRMCWCRQDETQGIDCVQNSGFNVEAGLFLVVGPYSGQTHTCTRGDTCTIGGIRGVGLSLVDRILPMASCRYYAVSDSYPSFPPPVFSLQADAATGGYKIELGDLPFFGSPELIEMCWCGVSSQADCTEIWHFTTVAVTLDVNCAPGWYELTGADVVCEPCPPGYYCTGGQDAARRSCPAGSTSVANSTTAGACECTEGYYWDATQNLCTACTAGTFKDTVGNSNCDSLCPEGTTSLPGAISIRECKCVGDTIDTVAAAENFTCTDLMELSANISSEQLASTEATIFSFSGVILVADASTEALLSEIQVGIASNLQVTSSRLSSEVEASPFNTRWSISYTVSTSQQSVAEIVRGNFDSTAFNAWVYVRMKGTALGEAEASEPSPIVRSVLQCPTGLAFADGATISGINDCQCQRGMQPSASGSSGLSSGCVKCAAGKYKSAVADSECTACPTGGNATLTTLFDGAISHAACTCSAGFLNFDPLAPSKCQFCGAGFYCLGGSHHQQCQQSTTTAGVNASSAEECICVAGFFPQLGSCNPCEPGTFKAEVANTPCTPCAPGNFSGLGQSECAVCEAGSYSTGQIATCLLCPAGRYSESQAAQSVDACLACEAGKWSNATGLAQVSGCIPCVRGSTTVLDGAESESMCVQPDGLQSWTCTSGRVCTVEGVTGSRLQDGHRLAITTSDCSSAKSPQEGIASNGISKLATASGSQYVWGDSPSDFKPQGGSVNLCWCANIGALTCEGLNSNFWLSAGTMLVIGPLESTFACVRGRDCLDLQPFSGYGLTAADHVRIQRDSCGAAGTVEMSTQNEEGTGTLQMISTAGSLTQLSLSFGKSDAENDFNLQVDANQAGYLLCWCSSSGSSACAQPSDFVVYAGRLSVYGPSTNQEKGCAVGQPCALSGVLGASITSGDRLMILSDCGRGSAILGFPGQGMLDSSDGTNFAFAGNGAKILLSVPGIFRICFCRPITGVDACDSSIGFIARVGLMTASGPFARTTICYMGGKCTVSLSGVGLTGGDLLWIANGECGSAEGIEKKGFVDLQNPIAVQEGADGFTVNLGTLPFKALPGLYQMCWCPQNAICSSTALFRAPAGSLQADCPPGSFASGPASGLICELCSRGFYCAGGRPERAKRTQCTVGETTFFKGSVSESDCVCSEGYGLQAGETGCIACAIGFYKNVSGGEECTPCPPQFTTYGTGSVSSSSCYEVTPASSNSSTLQSEASVPAVSFTFSIGELPATEDQETLRQQLIEMFVTSLAAATGMDPSAIEIDFGSLFGRRLSRRLFDLSTITITINTRSEDEAQRTAGDLDVSTLNNEISGAVQSNPTLSRAGIQLNVSSEPQTIATTIVCGQYRSVPPGVPIQSKEDCQCSPGYGYDPATGAWHRAMQTIQSSFVKKALLPSQGDQIQVQVLEMAVRELKPDAEPPALDSPETDLIDAADAVVLPAPRPKAMVKGPSPRPAPRAVPTAPRPAPSDETPSSSQPVPTSPTRLPASPTSAPKRMPSSQVGRSIKTAARPSPDVIVSPSAVAADVNQPVRLERQMTSETEEEEEEPSDEEQ